MKFIISCSLLLIFITTFLSCCEDKVGARVIRASCTLRYEKYKFCELTVQPPQPPPPPPPPPPPLSSPSTNHTSSQGKTHISRTGIIIAIPITIAIFVLAFICTYLRLRARLQQL